MLVFISYSHDSAPHRDRVLGLSERLRDDGYETRLDQYVNGTPLEGWPRWMMNGLDEAEYVLVVCTETYYRRFRGHDVPDRGFGVDWEGMLISTEIYDAKSKTIKFVPVLFDPADKRFIPEPLRAATHHTLNSEPNYESLKDFLDQAAGVEPRPVGKRPVRERRKGTSATFDSPSTTPRVFHLPQAKNPHFVGREDLLKQLDEMLRTEGPAALVQVVSGMGGVGKTQLAVEYAHRNQSKYDVVWSVRCEQASTLASDYAALADRLEELADKVVADQSVVVQAVRRWLESNGRWLLVMDNVVNPDDVNEYLPDNPAGDIIITSQNQNWYGRARKLPVEKFHREESLDLLLDKGKRPSEKLPSAEALAEALGDLPLALAQAAAYIDATGTTIENYLNLYEERRSKLWEREKPPVGYLKTVAETLSIATDRVRAENEPALRLLNLCALMAPDDIPRELLASSVADPFDFDEQLASLRRYSLLDVTDDSVSVHRLVQTICRDRWNDAERAEFRERAVAIVDSTWPPGNFQNDPSTWPTCARLTPHARAVLSHAADSGTTSDLWLRRGMYLRLRADFSEARLAYESSVRIAESVFGPNSTELANRLNNLAALLLATNRLAEAEPLMTRVVKILENPSGEPYPNYAGALNNLAQLLKATNRLAEAEPLMRRALGIDEQSYGADHPDAAIRLNNLALLLKATNRLAEAEPLMARVVSILEKSYGENHPNVATALNNLAVLLQATNRLAEAEPLMARVVTIFEKSYGENHPNVAVALNNLAQLLQAKAEVAVARNDWDNRSTLLAEAEPLMRRALAIDEQSYGAEHPNVALKLWVLAVLLRRTERSAEALPLMRRAMGIYHRFSKLNGYEHPDWKNALWHYFGMLAASGKTTADIEAELRRLQEK